MCQRKVLEEINKVGGGSLSRLANTTSFSRDYLWTNIQNLIKNGFLTTTPSFRETNSGPKNVRVYKISLLGEEFLKGKDVKSIMFF